MFLPHFQIAIVQNTEEPTSCIIRTDGHLPIVASATSWGSHPSTFSMWQDAVTTCCCDYVDAIIIIITTQ